MPRVEYRVAHWYETFVIGLIVATSIWLTLYKTKHRDDSSKSIMTRFQKFYATQQTDDIDALLKNIIDQKEVLKDLQMKIRAKLNACNTSGDCSPSEVQLLQSLLSSLSEYDVDPHSPEFHDSN